MEVLSIIITELLAHHTKVEGNMKCKFLVVVSFVFVLLLDSAISFAFTVVIKNNSTEHIFKNVAVNACNRINRDSCSDSRGGDIAIGNSGTVNTGANCPKYIILSTFYPQGSTSVQRSQCIFPTTNTPYSYPSGCVAECSNSVWEVKIMDGAWRFTKIQ
jgi:hypothetical protein